MADTTVANSPGSTALPDIPVRAVLSSTTGSTGKVVQAVTSGFSLPDYDYVAVTYPDTVTETYTFKANGSGGTTVGTITLVYTDSTKASLTSATKT